MTIHQPLKVTTTKSIEKPTPRRAVALALAHFRQPGVKYGFDGVHCAYRAADGGMCAVGCLIPDEVQPENMMGGVDALLVHHGDTFRGWENDAELVRVLKDMQAMHDIAALKGVPMSTLVGRLEGYSLAKFGTMNP